MLKRSGNKIVRRRTALAQRLRLAIAALFCLLLALIALVYFAEQQTLPDAGEPPESLRVITRISPNTYYEGDNGPSGFEYALLERFARRLGKELQIDTTDSLADLFLRLERNQVQLASAGLSQSTELGRRFVVSRPYLQSQPLVVYRVGNSRPRQLDDLIGREIVVIANSHHAELLAERRNIHPEIHWREVDKVDYIDVLGRVERGDIDYTVIDSTEFMLHRGFFPRVEAAFALGQQQSFAWFFPREARNSPLYHEANRFIRDIAEDGTLAKLEEQYYGQAAHINQVAANEFDKNIAAKLPRHLDSIKSAASEAAMDWRLLAAISYQESRWNPLARSRTGVRGFMMLTLPTAREVGVNNRLDAEQSLRGGASYFKYLKARLPAEIEDPDRSWFALAAYNIGFGHLEDARQIAIERGGSGNNWYELKQALPLLTQKKWYSKTRYGYARGYEAVHYVQNIRHYYHVLSWRDLALQRELPTQRVPVESEDLFFPDGV